MSAFSSDVWALNKQREALQTVIELATHQHKITGENDYLITVRSANSMLGQLTEHKKRLDAANEAKLREWAEHPEFQHLKIYLDLQDKEDRKDAAI